MDKSIRFAAVIVGSFLFFLFGWFSHQAYAPAQSLKPTLLSKIKKNKQLNVVLLNSPSTYYIGAEGPQGFEYDLLKLYADHLGVDLNITVASTVKEAISYIGNPSVHIISSSLAKTKEREGKFNFGPSYFEVQEQVICHRGMIGSGKFPKDIESLIGLNIMVGEGTSYSETIKSFQADGYDINATFTSEFSTEELLEKVANYEIDCTIADSNIYALNLRYFTEILFAFTISGREQLAWVLPVDSKELEVNMYAWLNQLHQTGVMAELKDHYYSYVMHFDYYNTKMFYKRIETRLPKYKRLFIKASNHYAIPWKLLAAISYQESHWNPKAKSFTGVRGMMMLTLTTAKILGVTNRLDPKQSIMGGTRHLGEMIRLIPEDVEGENRLKFALAAYNVGLGHVQDARELAERLGYDKNIWSDLKKVLPLLAQKRYYQTLKHGYARGSEPVKYVESIYNYRAILENYFQEKKEEKLSQGD